MNRKKTHESVECIASFFHHPHLRAVCVTRCQEVKGSELFPSKRGKPHLHLTTEDLQRILKPVLEAQAPVPEDLENNLSRRGFQTCIVGGTTWNATNFVSSAKTTLPRLGLRDQTVYLLQHPSSGTEPISVGSSTRVN